MMRMIDAISGARRKWEPRLTSIPPGAINGYKTGFFSVVGHT